MLVLVHFMYCLLMKKMWIQQTCLLLCIYLPSNVVSQFVERNCYCYSVGVLLPLLSGWEGEPILDHQDDTNVLALLRAPP